jgi:ubiquinone/menaquinone biosynthesis C-methylase UbiE
MKNSDWNELREQYGEIMRKRATGELPEMAQVTQFMKLFRENYKKGMNVLDIGCGAGHFLTSLQKLDTNIVYHGVDIDSHYIKIARDVWKGKSTASFSVGTTTALKKLGADSSDISISYMVLPFIYDYKTALRECMRVTRHHIFLRLMLSDHTYIIKRYKWKDRQLFYYNIYNQEEFIDACISNGAKNVTIMDDDFKLEIPYTNGWDTYTYGNLQLSGNIVLPWKVVHLEK